jgi:serine O-acetyltransferase
MHDRTAGGPPDPAATSQPDSQSGSPAGHSPEILAEIRTELSRELSSELSPGLSMESPAEIHANGNVNGRANGLTTGDGRGRLNTPLVSRIANQICSEHHSPSWRSSDHPDASLPSVAQVVRIITRLEEIFFPCYRSRRCLSDADASRLVTGNLEWLYSSLRGQIERALPFRWLGDYARTCGAEPATDLAAETDRITDAFFETIPGVRERLMLDVEAAYCGDPAALSYAEVILSYPGLRAITVHRIAHQLYQLNVPLLPRMMSEHVHACTGIDIHPGARIGHSFFIDHGTGVVIGETTEIGDQVKLFQGVTMGARSFPLDENGMSIKRIKRHPTIGSGVVVYAGATILGDITIGDHSEIGGNVWLTESVGPYSRVIQEHHQLVKITQRRSR